MAEGIVEIAIIRSVISYVSRLHKAYRRGSEPRVTKTIFSIPDELKESLKRIVIICKNEDVFSELDALLQNPDRVKKFEESHRNAFQEFQNEFAPVKFMKWFAVAAVIGAELEIRGFKKALDVVERDIHAAYSLYREHEIFKHMGFSVT